MITIINSFSEAWDKISNVYDLVKGGIESSIDGLQTGYDTLVDFDERLVAAIDSGFATEFGSLPVADAIGTFRYLVGDYTFMLIYLVVLIGCLFTIYKIIALIYEVVLGWTNGVKVIGSGKSHLSNLNSWFNK